ncbi:titin-like isoform X1 [Gossypium australe]|uniref:Elongation factor Ts, mitochondrial n=1 Tax=Gossypium australe TaxID=47621 RepID=A0A5B6WW08_9ROSI|nr:titin-like isoform X1 [Gossypium australe]
MKKEEDNDNLDSQLSQGVVYTAMNPFMLAFHNNKEIAAEKPEKIEVQTVADATAAGELVEKETDTVANIANKEETTDKETEESFEVSSPESSAEVPLVNVVESDETLGSSGEIVDQVTTSESSVVGEDSDAKDEVQVETPVTEDKIPSATSVQDDEVGAIPKENGSVGSTYVQPDVPDLKDVEDTAEDNVSSDPSQELADDQIKSSVSEAIEEAENKVENTEDEVRMDSPETLSAFEVKEVEPPPQKNDELREETEAGMMDCKKALLETGGDIVKAQEFLRKKGLAGADKKASRVTAEGRIGSYIHDSKIGVLLEVNCETDFVSRGDIFKELVDDLAMQVAASSQVQYLVPEDVPEDIVNKEREIEMQKEDLLSKPEQIRSKIVEGRIRKRLEELALLEQPYIKNDKLVVKDWVKQTIATIGENIKVKRFVRFNLREGLEKKSQDFAAEVAAQTAAKPVSTVEKKQPASLEAKETDQKCRDDRLQESSVQNWGDLEKAQEYLRMKGLSTAGKKSSRLAAEGRIGSYIHDSRIGVLIEVNCETDFVGGSEKFKELVDNLAMQFVSIEDIPESTVSKEKELEMQREDLASKPDNIREKIVEWRVSNRLGELALLEQPYIKDDSVLIKDLVKQTVAAIGENIKVRRFVRFTLGETVEDTKTGTEA